MTLAPQFPRYLGHAGLFQMLTDFFLILDYVGEKGGLGEEPILIYTKLFDQGYSYFWEQKIDYRDFNETVGSHKHDLIAKWVIFVPSCGVYAYMQN